MRWLLSLCLGLILFSSGCANMMGDADQMENKPAPLLFTGTWMNSERLPLDSLRGYVVLLEFWSSSCPACQKAIPHMNELMVKYANYPFKIIAVHPLKKEEDIPALQDLVVELGIRYPVVSDVGRNTQAVYKLDFVPAIFLIDKKGIVRYTNEGAPDFSEVQKKIEELLAEPAN